MNYEKLNCHTEYSTFSLDSVEAYLKDLEAIQTGVYFKDISGNYIKMDESKQELDRNQITNITQFDINLNPIPEPASGSENENDAELPKIQCIFCRNAKVTDIVYKTKEELQGHLALCIYHPERSTIASGSLICGLCGANFGLHKHNYDLHITKCKLSLEKKKIANEVKRKKDAERLEQSIHKYVFELKKLRSVIPANINKTVVLTILEEITMLFKLLPEGILVPYIKDIYNLK